MVLGIPKLFTKSSDRGSGSGSFGGGQHQSYYGRSNDYGSGSHYNSSSNGGGGYDASYHSNGYSGGNGYYANNYNDDEDNNTVGDSTINSETKSILRRGLRGRGARGKRNNARSVSWSHTFDTYEEGGVAGNNRGMAMMMGDGGGNRDMGYGNYDDGYVGDDGLGGTDTFETIDTLDQMRDEQNYHPEYYDQNYQQSGGGTFETMDTLGRPVHEDGTFETVDTLGRPFQDNVDGQRRDHVHDFREGVSNLVEQNLIAGFNYIYPGETNMSYGADNETATRDDPTSTYSQTRTYDTYDDTITDRRSMQSTMLSVSVSSEADGNVEIQHIFNNEPQRGMQFQEQYHNRPTTPVGGSLTMMSSSSAPPPPPPPQVAAAPRPGDRKQLMQPSIVTPTASQLQPQQSRPLPMPLQPVSVPQSRQVVSNMGLMMMSPQKQQPQSEYRNLACLSTVTENTLEAMKDRYGDDSMPGDYRGLACMSDASENTLEAMRQDRYGGMAGGDDDEDAENSMQVGNVATAKSQDKKSAVGKTKPAKDPKASKASSSKVKKSSSGEAKPPAPLLPKKSRDEVEKTSSNLSKVVKSPSSGASDVNKPPAQAISEISEKGKDEVKPKHQVVPKEAEVSSAAANSKPPQAANPPPAAKPPQSAPKNEETNANNVKPQVVNEAKGEVGKKKSVFSKVKKLVKKKDSAEKSAAKAAAPPHEEGKAKVAATTKQRHQARRETPREGMVDEPQDQAPAATRVEAEQTPTTKEEAVKPSPDVFTPQNAPDSTSFHQRATSNDSGILDSILNGNVSNNSGSAPASFDSASFEENPMWDEDHIRAMSDDESITSLTKRQHSYDGMFKNQKAADASAGHIGLILPFSWKKMWNPLGAEGGALLQNELLRSTPDPSDSAPVENEMDIGDKEGGITGSDEQVISKSAIDIGKSPNKADTRNTEEETLLPATLSIESRTSNLSDVEPKDTKPAQNPQEDDEGAAKKSSVFGKVKTLVNKKKGSTKKKAELQEQDTNESPIEEESQLVSPLQEHQASAAVEPSDVFIPQEAQPLPNNLSHDSGSLGSPSMEDEPTIDDIMNNTSAYFDDASFEENPTWDEDHIRAMSDDESITSLTKRQHSFDGMLKNQKAADTDAGHIGLILPFSWKKMWNPLASNGTMFESWDGEVLKRDLLRGASDSSGSSAEPNKPSNEIGIESRLSKSEDEDGTPTSGPATTKKESEVSDAVEQVKLEAQYAPESLVTGTSDERSPSTETETIGVISPSSTDVSEPAITKKDDEIGEAAEEVNHLETETPNEKPASSTDAKVEEFASVQSHSEVATSKQVDSVSNLDAAADNKKKKMFGGLKKLFGRQSPPKSEIAAPMQVNAGATGSDSDEARDDVELSTDKPPLATSTAVDRIKGDEVVVETANQPEAVIDGFGANNNDDAQEDEGKEDVSLYDCDKSLIDGVSEEDGDDEDAQSDASTEANSAQLESEDGDGSELSMHDEVPKGQVIELRDLVAMSSRKKNNKKKFGKKKIKSKQQQADAIGRKPTQERKQQQKQQKPKPFPEVVVMDPLAADIFDSPYRNNNASSGHQNTKWLEQMQQGGGKQTTWPWGGWRKKSKDNSTNTTNSTGQRVSDRFIPQPLPPGRVCDTNNYYTCDDDASFSNASCITTESILTELKVIEELAKDLNKGGNAAIESISALFSPNVEDMELVWGGGSKNEKGAAGNAAVGEKREHSENDHANEEVEDKKAKGCKLFRIFGRFFSSKKKRTCGPIFGVKATWTPKE